jgi:hypothetical protein
MSLFSKVIKQISFKFSNQTFLRVSVVLPVLMLLLPASGGAQPDQLVINEIMASNLRTIADEDGDFSDWIEIYNNGGQTINLSGYGLSDDSGRPFRWIFPEIAITPGEFLLVWASGKNRTDGDRSLHTGFSISSAGEDILLTGPDGTLIDRIPAVPLPADVSYGRKLPGSEELAWFLQPTPGYANHHESFTGILPAPSFSLPAGFYEPGQQVAMSHPDPMAEIRYTLDGSLPDYSSADYLEPLQLASLEGTPNGISEIRTNPPEVPPSLEWYPPVGEVDKAHTVRAVAFKPGYIPSPAVTATWFTGQPLPELPVFSIVTGHDNLFDHERGIYIPGLIYEQNGYGDGWYGQLNANYFQRGSEWEVPASLEFFENGQSRLQQDVGIRIHGGGTRALPMKSLRIYARGGYGDSHLEYDFFPRQGIQKFNRLILRNHGQDFYGHGVLLRDGFMQKLAEPLGIPVQDYRPAIVFLNGEYWGIHNIRERYDENYFERKYGIPAGKLDFLESNQRVISGSAGHYSDMIAFVEENPLSGQEAFSHLQDMMDTDNFMDYYIVNIFYNNIDWPGHNLKYFRYSGDPVPDPSSVMDGRWRWAFNDFDFGFGNTSGLYPHNQNTLVYATHPEGSSWPPNPPWSTFLIRSLLENDEFKNGFINRFADLLNSIFRPGYMTSFLNEMKLAIEPEMPRHMRRWSHPGNGMEDWQTNIDRMIRYADRRPDHQTGHILGYFELDGTFMLKIDVNDAGAGTVRVNRLLLEDTGAVKGERDNVFPWEGTYFRNVPLPLTAVSFPGYEFVRWITAGGDEFFENPLIIDVTDDAELTAEFREREVIPPTAFSPPKEGPFLFTRWDRDGEAGASPDHMAFVYMDSFDPGAEARIEGFTTGRYDLDSRTRINGWNCGGVSFINTSSVDGNPGYPGGRLGGVLLALDTRDAADLHLMFHASTVSRNSRIYNLRLQYRLDDHGPFTDLPDASGEPVGYVSGGDGHSWNSGPVPLPGHLHGKDYVQLLWRYYYTGVREDESSGQRSELRIGSIAVFEGDTFPETDLLAKADIGMPGGFVCDNAEALFSAEFNDESPSTVYSWFAGDKALPGFTGSSIYFENPYRGIVLRVEVDDINSCLYGLPATGMISPEVVSAPEKAVIEQRGNSLFSSSESGNQWYESSLGAIPGAEQQEFSPEDTGNYFVIVTDGHCYSNPSDTVAFEPTSNGPEPGESDPRIIIRPNPAGPTIRVIRARISDPNPEFTQWSVYDLSGKLNSIGTIEGISADGEFSIDISTLAPGVYILRLLSGDKTTPRRKTINAKFIRH